MLTSDRKLRITKTWTIFCISVTILKALEESDEKLNPLSEQILEATILELSKSLLKLNDGQWD